jgi:short-subunit dehydrogenase
VHIDVPRSRGVQTMVKVYVDTHGGDQMLDVNLKFVNVCVVYKIRATFAAGSGGAIVNIASTSS